MNTIQRLNGVYYDWKTEEYPEKQFSTNRQLGFIAQEMQKVYPELVITDSQGYLAVDYQRFTAVLLEAVKEQQKEIDNWQLTIGNLEKHNEIQQKLIEATQKHNEAQQKQVEEQQKQIEEQQKLNKLLQKRIETLEKTKKG